MIGDTAHISLVQCIDIDGNIYDLTRVVSEKLIKTEVGQMVSGTIEFYHKGQIVDWQSDGSFELFVKGKSVIARELEES